jgi:mono/diheme cytochrome c family protein
MPQILSTCAIEHCFQPVGIGYESRLLPAACDGNLMQKLAIKLSRCGQTSVLLFALAMAAGPALAQAPRGAHTPARPGQPAATAPRPPEPANIDAGKNGEQLFKANCSACHKTPVGLSRAGGILGVQSFLREHYTASRESAAAIAAYLIATDAAARPGDRPARRTARPDARPAKKDEGKPSETKPAEAKPAETKPAEAKPAQVKPEESPRPPASVPAAESKPAEPQPPPAAPAEQKPADAPKAE